MKYCLLLFVLLVACNAADPQKPCDKGSGDKLSTCEVERWQRLGLQLQAIQTEAQRIAGPLLQDQQRMREEICGRAKVDLAKCTVDVQNGKVAKLQEPPPPPTAKK